MQACSQSNGFTLQYETSSRVSQATAAMMIDFPQGHVAQSVPHAWMLLHHSGPLLTTQLLPDSQHDSRLGSHQPFHGSGYSSQAIHAEESWLAFRLCCVL